jgi:hypothetical protein
MSLIDERALQFDLDSLEPGDRIEVFLDGEERWTRGQLELSAAGVALVLMTRGEPISLEHAIRMGVRRVLH